MRLVSMSMRNTSGPTARRTPFVVALLAVLSLSANAAALSTLGSSGGGVACAGVGDWVQSSIAAPETGAFAPGAWQVVSWHTHNNGAAAVPAQLEIWHRVDNSLYRLQGLSPVEMAQPGDNVFTLPQPIAVQQQYDTWGLHSFIGTAECGGLDPDPHFTVAYRTSATVPSTGDIVEMLPTPLPINKLNVAVDVEPATRFNPVPSVRLLDSRIQPGTPSLVQDDTTAIAVRGVAGIPIGAAAVALNVTATNSDAGFVTIVPCGPPLAFGVLSQLNPRPGYAVANLVHVAIAANGTVCLTTQGRTDLIVDVVGWYGSTGALYNPLPVTRLVDTRLGVGAPLAHLAAGQVLEVQTAGKSAMPANAVAALFNITATNSEAGYLTVYPCDQPRPLASSLNPQPAFAVANLVQTPISTTGSVCIYSERPTDVIVDLQGWFGATGEHIKLLDGQRIVDTRSGLGAPAAPLQGGQTLPLTINNPPCCGLKGVMLNLTATNSEAGYLTVYPCDQPRPTTSNLNAQPVFAVANLAVVSTSATQTVCVYTERATDLIIDRIAYVLDQAT